MTARKIAVAVVLCGVAVYFLVTWGIERFRARDEEPEPEPEREPDRIEDARLVTTSSAEGADAATLVPWRVAFASPDIPLGATVSVGEFGADADALSVRQRGDVVASEMLVVGHRTDLPPRTIAPYVGDLGDEFALGPITLLLRTKEG